MKILKKLVILLLSVLALSLILIISIIVMENIHPPLDRADAIVVLGSARAPSARERALEGLKLYGEGKAPLIILSGGQTDLATTEASYMESVIRQASSTPQLLLENQSLSTIENLTDTHRLAPNVLRIIIVSDDYHILRAFLIAKHVGFKQVLWSTPDESYLPFVQHISLYWTDIVKLIDIVSYLFGR